MKASGLKIARSCLAILIVLSIFILSCPLLAGMLGGWEAGMQPPAESCQPTLEPCLSLPSLICGYNTISEPQNNEQEISNVEVRPSSFHGSLFVIRYSLLNPFESWEARRLGRWDAAIC